MSEVVVPSYINICKYIPYIYIYIYIYVCVCVCVYIYMCVCVCLCVYPGESGFCVFNYFAVL